MSDRGKMDTNQYVDEAYRLVSKAQEKGVLLRILGSTAFRVHSPQFVSIHTAMDRPMTDIDFIAYGKQDRQFEAFLESEGYYIQKASLTPELYATRRIFNHSSNGIHIDIFMDELAMCHKISFKGRLEVDSPTIPLAELVLEKTQIVTLAEKDVKDMLILLAAHPIGDHDNDTINGKYIANLLGNDWGFYYTTNLSLEKVRQGIETHKHLFKPEDIVNIRERLEQLSKMIEDAPKTFRWKARAAIGTKVKWYTEVDEVERAEHLNEL
jgi:hypothetical protein